jgi:hypothetical protein
MARVRRLNVSQIEGGSASDNNIRPNGEIALYENGNNFDFVIHNGQSGSVSNKVFSKGIFYGHGNDSADGAGLNTIKLIPDFGVFNSGSEQYIVVDPTVPNHIHLRAGGPIDDSNAALFLGGENSHVEVQAGLNPPVYVRANNNTWMFDVDGDLTFPGLSNARIGEDEPGLVVRSGNGFAVLTNANSANTYEVEFIGYVSNGFGDSPGATLTVTEIIGGTITNGMTVYGAGLPSEGWALTFGGVMEPQGSGGVGNYLLSGANYLTSFQSFNNGVLAAGSQAWVFESNGDLTFPDNTVQTTAWTGIASEGTTSTTSANVGYIGMPQNPTSTSYTLVASDQGKHIYVTTAGQTITVPANSTTAFPIGTTIAIIAGPTANPVTIAITSDTMYLGGVGSTGTRTLAAYGMATLVKVDATTWFINGSGLT